MLKLARTNAEAHLYMAQQPCGCGALGFAGGHLNSAVIVAHGDLATRYTGRCAGCGAMRCFEFRLPEEPLAPPRRGVQFGGAEPSRLLDPGEWMAIADDHAMRVPASGGTAEGERANAVALAAIGEVLKFFPAGAEACPPEAFTSARGRAIYAAEPGRFRRVRLEAVRDTYAALGAQN